MKQPLNVSYVGAKRRMGLMRRILVNKSCSFAGVCVTMASQACVWCFLAVASVYVTQLPFCCISISVNLCLRTIVSIN